MTLKEYLRKHPDVRYFAPAGANGYLVEQVREIVADTALSGAFVPVFSELLEKGERARAWRVASTISCGPLIAATAAAWIGVKAP